jgi:hypothetical protein
MIIFLINQTIYYNIMERLIRKILKEEVMYDFIESAMPELNNLKRKSNFSSNLYGYNTIYYNPKNKEYYFRVSEARRALVWDFDDDDEITKYKDLPKTLWIDGRTYDEIQNYIPDDNMILKWFNEKYKQDAKVLKRKSPLKK